MSLFLHPACVVGSSSSSGNSANRNKQRNININNGTSNSRSASIPRRRNSIPSSIVSQLPPPLVPLDFEEERHHPSSASLVELDVSSTLPPNNVSSPSSPITSYETVTTIPVTTQAQEQRLEELKQQTYHLSIASASSAVIVTVVMVPVQVLAGAGVVMACVCLLVRAVYLRTVLDVEMRLRGRGFGDMIPQGIYQALTETSAHEALTQGRDTVGGKSWWLLYMLPGITKERLDDYVSRLAPEQRDMLTRPGLGHLLGPKFMRILLGDQQMQEQMQEHFNTSNSSSITAKITAEDLIKGLTPEQATQVATQLGWTEEHETEYHRCIEILEEEEREAAERAKEEAKRLEDEVVSEALDIAIDNLKDAISSGILTLLPVPSPANVVSTAVYLSSLGICTVSAGIGLVGLMAGHYDAPFLSSRSSSTKSSPLFKLLKPGMFPAAGQLLATTAVSGGTAALMAMMGLPQTAKKKKHS